jgi:hypothetical protein
MDAAHPRFAICAAPQQPYLSPQRPALGSASRGETTMRNTLMPLAAALLIGLAAPALAQQAPAEGTAARTLTQNARVTVYQTPTSAAAQVPDAAPSAPVASARPPARRLAMASNQAR